MVGTGLDCTSLSTFKSTYSQEGQSARECSAVSHQNEKKKGRLGTPRSVKKAPEAVSERGLGGIRGGAIVGLHRGDLVVNVNAQLDGPMEPRSWRKHWTPTGGS